MRKPEAMGNWFERKSEDWFGTPEKKENRKATTDNRRDTGTGQQSASRQTPTGQGREE